MSDRNGVPQISGDSPAFPVGVPGCGDNGWHGMSLRDWFAGQALAGMLCNGATITVTGPALTPQRVMANAAYTLADAMLAARQP